VSDSVKREKMKNLAKNRNVEDERTLQKGPAPEVEQVTLENNGDFLGAVASNAGDKFHVLWATREMFRLLDDTADVCAVKVEGLPQDQIHFELGDHGQAVDVTLIPDSAKGGSYRYLQLKHSTTNPQTKWSWSRLLKKKAKTKSTSSVLGKLAGLMTAVGFEGNFAIVTNQPLCDKVAADIKRLVAPDAEFDLEERELIAKLTKALGLTPNETVIFLRTWDLSGFSSISRLAMESQIIQTLTSMTDADARDDANLLQNRVAALMLPESRNDLPVTRELLSVWLGVGGSGMLFPASSQIESAKPYLRRAVVDSLAEKLRSPQLKPLRLHAGGGCGKTSLICNLSSDLPTGSEVFLYDCYGGGLFLASDKKRHLSEHVFTQLGNEIAARLRTPMIMRRKASVDVFEAFLNRVKVAAGLLGERGPDALLVLAFDAVDNARTGSHHWLEDCFLDPLSQASVSMR
jgi:hypothetical protein